jgi:Holliday junction resolvasome RuvABC endonuclease subunit
MKVTGKILGLDLATRTGFAVGLPDEAPRFGTVVLPSSGQDVGAFAIAFGEWLNAMLDAELPQVVLYEQPSIFSKTTPATLIKLNGLAYDCERICKMRRFRCYMVNPSRLKKFFAGNGRAQKQDMIDVARREGWPVQDDNQADACAIFAYGVHCFAPAHARRFKFMFGLLAGVV